MAEAMYKTFGFSLPELYARAHTEGFTFGLEVEMDADKAEFIDEAGELCGIDRCDNCEAVGLLFTQSGDDRECADCYGVGHHENNDVEWELTDDCSVGKYYDGLEMRNTGPQCLNLETLTDRANDSETMVDAAGGDMGHYNCGIHFHHGQTGGMEREERARCVLGWLAVMPVLEQFAADERRAGHPYATSWDRPQDFIDYYKALSDTSNWRDIERSCDNDFSPSMGPYHSGNTGKFLAINAGNLGSYRKTIEIRKFGNVDSTDCKRSIRILGHLAAFISTAFNEAMLVDWLKEMDTPTKYWSGVQGKIQEYLGAEWARDAKWIKDTDFIYGYRRMLIELEREWKAEKRASMMDDFKTKLAVKAIQMGDRYLITEDSTSNPTLIEGSLAGATFPVGTDICCSASLDDCVHNMRHIRTATATGYRGILDPAMFCLSLPEGYTMFGAAENRSMRVGIFAPDGSQAGGFRNTPEFSNPV
jgi:hypothetical protein